MKIFIHFVFLSQLWMALGKGEGKPTRVISHHAVTTNPGQCSKKRPTHANSDVGLVLAWASSDETAV